MRIEDTPPVRNLQGHNSQEVSPQAPVLRAGDLSEANFQGVVLPTENPQETNQENINQQPKSWTMKLMTEQEKVTNRGIR